MKRISGGKVASRPWLASFVFFLLFLAAALGWARSAALRTAQDEDLVMLGKEELVEVSARENEQSIETLAKIDTGAGYSSIDEDLAEDLGIDLDNAEDKVEIESANGDEVRPLVRVRIRMAGQTLDTRVTVTDRSELTKDVLIGSRDLGGFLVKADEERLTTPDSPKN
jgi:hypothetical protein